LNCACPKHTFCIIEDIFISFKMMEMAWIPSLGGIVALANSLSIRLPICELLLKIGNGFMYNVLRR